MLTRSVFSHIFTICVLYVVFAFNKNEFNKPNIILIIADDLGWNDVGFHGSNQLPTPNIDALAYNGLILNRHYVLPTCTPSRASLMTGEYAIRTGLQGDPGFSAAPWALPLEKKILPQVRILCILIQQYLKELGYKTHLVGKWHLGFYRKHYTPTQRGFDSHFGYLNGWIRYNDSVTTSNGMEGIDARRNLTEAGLEFHGQYATDVLTNEAVNIIDHHDTKDPLFLQVSHVAVHAEKNDILEVRDLHTNNAKYDYIEDEKRRLFAGVLEALDDSVGRIIEALDRNRLTENSIVLFISDNGGATIDPAWKFANTASNWPLRGMKTSLFEGGIRGVAAIWSPYIASGNRVTNELFHISDWLPTFLDAAGGDVDSLKIDGVNQWDFLTDKTSKSNREEILVNINDERRNSAIIRKNWKLIRCESDHRPTFADNYAGESGREGEYKLDSVMRSVTNKILQKYSQRTAGPNVNVSFLEIRDTATIDQKCRQRIKDERKIRVIPCRENRLYNVEKDPCEYYNAEETAPELVRKLKARLDYFETVKIPAQKKRIDDRADPKYFSGYWSWWLDEDESNVFITIVISVICAVVTAIVIYNRMYAKLCRKISD